ncbi:MAG TPA: 3-hydroxyacyl-ACP dehydratase FabZ family protein [Gemmatimonadaceae bacterium]|jgi:3-hydroxyacyl-[acyl-carrier-protein] dehydratase
MIHSSYSSEGLHRLLPHRHPLLLVDRIDVLEPGKHVVGMKLLSASEWWAQEDRAAAFPFTLVLEALAQASGALIAGLTVGAQGAIAYFMGADHVRFRAPARAGDRLSLDVTLLQWRRGICRTRGVARLTDGSVVTTAQLTTIIRGVA